DSLRIQHLKNMTVLLHKSLEKNDYKRASRALGLVLTTPIHGSTIDIRNAGLWNIGAEILLQNNLNQRQELTEVGFGSLKQYHERLALQYPWHRSWTTVINAQDFKLNMYNLWVYVVVAHSKTLQHADDGDHLGDRQVALESEWLAREYELAEAEHIAQVMDTCMSTLPFVDDRELVRLRGMVALWVGDLIEDVARLQDEVKGSRERSVHEMFDPYITGAAEDLQNTSRESLTGNLMQLKAQDARATAQKMFSKLSIREASTSEGSAE
ncbi:hypothetical protein LTR66_017133, partial [Elasticomyces elasticus]